MLWLVFASIFCFIFSQAYSIVALPCTFSTLHSCIICFFFQFAIGTLMDDYLGKYILLIIIYDFCHIQCLVTAVIPFVDSKGGYSESKSILLFCEIGNN